MMNYDAADDAIRAINRQNLRIFNRLKARLMKDDELHIIRDVSDAYAESIAYVERRFLEVARKAYDQGAADANYRPRRHPIDGDWLIEHLYTVDPVTLYSFLDEAERKKARLTEALSVTPNKAHEVDKALKLWTRQIGWTAVSVVDEATVEAFKDAGVLQVMWISKHDNRVCDECWERNGTIYDIDKIPPKPHGNCRCKLKPILEKPKASSGDTT